MSGKKLLKPSSLKLSSSADFMINLSIQNCAPFLFPNLFSGLRSSQEEVELKPYTMVSQSQRIRVPDLWSKRPLVSQACLESQKADAKSYWLGMNVKTQKQRTALRVGNWSQQQRSLKDANAGLTPVPERLLQEAEFLQMKTGHMHTDSRLAETRRLMLFDPHLKPVSVRVGHKKIPCAAAPSLTLL